MGLDIPVDHALLSFGTLTDGDPEPMFWTVGCSVSGAADVSVLPTSMATWWTDNLQTLTSSAVTLVATVAKLGPNDTGVTYEAAHSIAGTQGGALPPPNCAVLVKKLTAFGGRKARGRAYLPGISSVSGSMDSTGAFSPTDAATVGAAMNQLLDDANADAAGPFPLELLHSSSPPAPYLLTSFVCEPKLATQRRRMRP